MPRFAANLSMLFTEEPFLDRFAAAAQAGFHGIEYLFPYAFSPALLNEMLAESGLEQVLFNLPPGDWDAGERGLACLPNRQSEFRESVHCALEYAQALACPRLHVMAGIPPADGSPEEALETYIINLSYAAAQLGAAGIEALIEPINTRDMPGYLLNHSKQALEILRQVNAPNLKVQYDIYHMQIMEGDLAPTLEQLLPHIGHLQLADTPGRNEPGTGEIHYPFLFQHLDRLGYSGWIGCEYRPQTTTLEGLGWIRPWLKAPAP